MLLAVAHAKPFNANLYVVIATVLPVLYIALMLPGGPLQYMLKVMLFLSPPWRVLMLAVFIALGLTLQLFFGFGEGSAILSIARDHASSSDHWWAMAAVALMLPLAGVAGMLYLLITSLTLRADPTRIRVSVERGEVRFKPETSETQPPQPSDS